MAIEGIGLIAFLIAGLIIYLPVAFGARALIISTLLGASAALIVTALGGASIPPAHVLLGALCIRMFREKYGWVAIAHRCAFSEPGFWFLLTCVTALLSAYFFPRFFEGKVDVYSVARDYAGFGYGVSPLMPVSGNITQSFYLVGDLLCFLIFANLAQNRTTYQYLARSFCICALVNIAFAALDIATWATGTADLMLFVRNASYRMLNDADIGGFKRIVGSFSEASAFAYVTIGLYAFTFRLWLDEHHSMLSGFAAAVSFLLLLLSTSTTAYVALALLVLMQLVNLTYLVLRNQASQRGVFVLVLFPLVTLTLILTVLLFPSIGTIFQDLIETTLFNKLGSQSGVERGDWNKQAIEAFFATSGVGVGLGSIRTSSFLIAVVSNIGIVGSFFCAAFLLILLFGRYGYADDPHVSSIKSAARSACLALVTAGSISGSFIDLGLPFYIYAGILAGPYQQNQQSKSFHKKTSRLTK